MNNDILSLVKKLEWVEGDVKLVSKHYNMKMEVIVKDNEVKEVTAWIYYKDDWDIMYEAITLDKQLKSLIKKLYLY